ncbi:MAG: hypothetical protein AB8G11_17770 [Saprospiraceae bacterium]
MKFLTTILAIVLSLSLTAKENAFTGYIINKKGQRIEGKIKTRNVTVDQMKITFIEKQTKIVYKPADLIGYGYEHKGENEFGEDTYVWRHYKSKTAQSYAPRFYASKEVFMEIMEEGEVVLYDYYVEVPGDIENPYKRFFYMEKNGSDELIEISQENYVEITSIYLENHSDLSDKIGTVNHRFRHLWKIVRLYNSWSEIQEVNTRMADMTEETIESEHSEIKPF